MSLTLVSSNDNPKKDITLEGCIEIANRLSSVYDFKTEYPEHYQACIDNGWKSQMGFTPRVSFWTKEAINLYRKEFSSDEDFLKHADRTLLKAIQKLDWFNHKEIDSGPKPR